MIFNKTILEIVDENYVYARSLHYLGIDFFLSPHKTLSQVCRERGLNEEQVIKSFYLFDSCYRFSFSELKSYPIELLVEYLKHSHHIFIKDKLPFIVHLAKNLESNSEINRLLPEFVEEFISHIYEEEDSVFAYTKTLSDISKGLLPNPISELIRFKNFSLSNEFEHHQGDDEFYVIRSLVDAVNPTTLHENVLLKEVRAFDREMVYHAEIENRIFFPKAIKLEQETNAKIKLMSKMN